MSSVCKRHDKATLLLLLLLLLGFFFCKIPVEGKTKKSELLTLFETYLHSAENDLLTGRRVHLSCQITELKPETSWHNLMLAQLFFLHALDLILMKLTACT